MSKRVAWLVVNRDGGHTETGHCTRDIAKQDMFRLNELFPTDKWAVVKATYIWPPTKPVPFAVAFERDKKKFYKWLHKR